MDDYRENHWLLEAILIGRNSLCKGTEGVNDDEIIQQGDYTVQAQVMEWLMEGHRR